MTARHNNETTQGLLIKTVAITPVTLSAITANARSVIEYPGGQIATLTHRVIRPKGGLSKM